MTDKEMIGEIIKLNKIISEKNTKVEELYMKIDIARQTLDKINPFTSKDNRSFFIDTAKRVLTGNTFYMPFGFKRL